MTHEMYQLISHINREQKVTILMVSHDLKNVLPYATHMPSSGSETAVLRHRRRIPAAAKWEKNFWEVSVMFRLFAEMLSYPFMQRALIVGNSRIPLRCAPGRKPCAETLLNDRRRSVPMWDSAPWPSRQLWLGSAGGNDSHCHTRRISSAAHE